MSVQLYRVVGVRSDKSRRVLADGMPYLAAKKAADLVGTGIFAEVVIEPDDAPQPGSKSVEVFPPIVQPRDRM